MNTPSDRNNPGDQNASRDATRNGGNQAQPYKAKPRMDSEDADQDNLDQDAAGPDETDLEAAQPDGSQDKNRKPYSPNAGKDRQNRPLHAAKGNDEVMSQQERRT